MGQQLTPVTVGWGHIRAAVRHTAALPVQGGSRRSLAAGCTRLRSAKVAIRRAEKERSELSNSVQVQIYNTKEHPPFVPHTRL